MRLIGRDRELGELAAYEGVVGLAGEPGIGKSRLLEELGARCGGRTVLGGAATEFETDVPFAAFAELFDSRAASCPPSATAITARSARGWSGWPAGAPSC